MKTLIIQGSSNPKGNTFTIVHQIQQTMDVDVLDLTTIDILPFDYQFRNQKDDFNATIHNCLDNYDRLVFATPVYWYTMSGIMKNFIDRFTDSLLYDKTLAVKFEKKHMAAIACGSSKEAIEGFFIPFQKSANYLKMNYLGDIHLWIDASKSISKQAHQRLNSFLLLLQ